MSLQPHSCSPFILPALLTEHSCRMAIDLSTCQLYCTCSLTSPRYRESSSCLFRDWRTSLKTSESLAEKNTQFHSFLLNFTSSYFSQYVSATTVSPNSSCSSSHILPMCLPNAVSRLAFHFSASISPL